MGGISANPSSTGYSGGIIGRHSEDTITIDSSSSVGNISADGGSIAAYSGGITRRHRRYCYYNK